MLLHACLGWGQTWCPGFLQNNFARRPQVPDAVAAAYAKAQKLLDLRRPYEEAVCGEGRSPDAELLAAYMAYAKAEEAQGDPARVQVRRNGPADRLRGQACVHGCG